MISASGKQIASIQIQHPDHLWPMPWEDVFPVMRPVEIDIGAGDGGFIIQAAKQFPQTNFFGIERLLGRVRKIERRTRANGLDNVRVFKMENNYTVKYLIPKGSVRAIHLYHPDPFPKKKQQKRRLVTVDFIHAVADLLERGGVFYVRTDHEEYFQIIEQCIQESGRFTCFCGINPYQKLVTDFEKEYQEKGVKINYSQYTL